MNILLSCVWVPGLPYGGAELAKCMTGFAKDAVMFFLHPCNRLDAFQLTGITGGTQQS
jgi:hypothetical protein